MFKKYSFPILFLFIFQAIGCFYPLMAYHHNEKVWECLSRNAFPTTCRNHFADNVTTADSWIEAEDKDTISSFSQYLDLIPQCYEADCCHCYDCGGVSFNLYRGYDNPIDDLDSFDLLVNLHTQTGRGLKKDCKRESDHCEELCWNGAYFRRWNHKDIHFFKQFLIYCNENNACTCYWPEINKQAAIINNSVYELLIELADNNLLSKEISPFWKSTSFFYNYGQKIHPCEYSFNAHGVASSLTTYTFFYSQYHQLLFSVIEFIDFNDLFGNKIVIDKIYALLEEIRKDFIYKYSRCLRWHSHPKIYYERGMLKMHDGNFEDAFSDVNHFMQLVKKQEQDFNLTSDIYQQEGKIYNELGMYDQAIQALTKAIELDPSNRGAYFNRAQAYFETGEFDLSIQDYMSSHIHESSYSTKLKPSLEIKQSILKGLLEGGEEAAVNFFPSLCQSAYGLGTSLWTFVKDPIDSTNNMINACYEMGQNISDICKNIDFTNTEIYVEEFQRIQGNLDKLSESEKAHLTGFLIGKYGVDIFAGGATLKSVAFCKKLKDANRIANLEALAISGKSKEILKATALNHAAKRDAFFKNVKIHWGRQDKHIPGKRNYQEGKSILTHQNPDKLLKKYAGKGKSVRGNIGESGYQEIIDFGEHIGYNVDLNGIKTETTWGKIHYSKDGAHIVPTKPRN